MGICLVLGGVSTLARMVWGTFLEKNLPRSNGHLLGFGGGLNPCQDGLGHLCSENGSSIRYFPLLTRDLRLARILCGTHIPSKRWFDKVAQIGPEKSAPEGPFECGGGGGGGGCNRYLGNAQIEVTPTSVGLPLTKQFKNGIANKNVTFKVVQIQQKSKDSGKVVNCPTRWSLLLLIGYWCRSSSWRWQPHIRGCRLHYPLPRAEMRFLVQFFSKMYLLYVSIWWTNWKQHFFAIFHPSKTQFSWTLWNHLATFPDLRFHLAGTSNPEK